MLNSTFETTAACNGALQDFTFNFKITTDSDLYVILRTLASGDEALLALTTDYSVTRIGTTSGDIHTVATYAATYQLIIRRKVVVDQDATFGAGGIFPAAALEGGLDYLGMIAQNHEHVIGPAGISLNAARTKLSWSGASGRSISWGPNSPTVGTRVSGDLHINNAPTAGSAWAWFCVSGGTPGSWTAIYGSLSVPGVMPGGLVRPKFSYNSGNSIKIGPGAYDMDATTGRQTVYWDQEFTFVLGPGGSNGGSSAIGANQWHYLCIDDSRVTIFGPKITAAWGFVTSTSPPGWSVAKHGWYISNFRCIFAVRTSGASLVWPFYHPGPFSQFAERQVDFALQDVDVTPVAVTLTAPTFCRAAMCTAYLQRGAETKEFYFGEAGIGTHFLGMTDNPISANAFVPSIDSSQMFYVNAQVAGTSQIQIACDGWFLPEGI